MPMGWVKHTDDKNLPDWLKSNLMSYCVCGTEKENYYNPGGSCTARRCPNRECPKTLAQKISAMCDILEVKGVAYGTGLKLANDRKLKSHFESVPFIFRERPTITLYQLLRITFIEGIDTKWQQVCEAYSSADELAQMYQGDLRGILHQNMEEIKYGEKFFNIQKSRKMQFAPLIRGTVMLSGHIRGFEDRDDFIRGINYYSKGLVSIGISKGKRKTGIMCLIQEKDEPYRGKAECALEAGIPIMDPEEFKCYILSKLKKKLEEGA